jgi:hypothetical protein
MLRAVRSASLQAEIKLFKHMLVHGLLSWQVARHHCLQSMAVVNRDHSSYSLCELQRGERQKC